jgi:hypothetical protein
MTAPQPSRPLLAARAFLERGFSVIPVGRDKRPLIQWQEYQRRRPTAAELDEWFTDQSDRNVGIVCGKVSGVVVVDTDDAMAEAWASAHLPESPMMCRTAKGTHRYFGHPGQHIRNAARLTTGDATIALDVRGDGGYVVAPGSVHASGTVYEAIGTWPPHAELPTFDPRWLEPEPRRVGKAESEGREDRATRQGRDVLIRRARAYLANTPPAIEGQGGDAHTFQVCCRVVRGFDLSDSEGLELLGEWNQRCVPPWSEHELQQKIESARKYGDEPIGGRMGAATPPERPVTTHTKTVSEQSTTPNQRAVSDAPDGIDSAYGGVTRADFRAYLPMHRYIFTPTREAWPAASVNGLLPPIARVDEDGRPVTDADGVPKTDRPSAWLDKHQHVEQLTWAPGEQMIILDRLVADGGWLERAGCSCFNLYRPPLPIQGDAAKAGPWVAHVRRVYPDEAAHIMEWLAHRVQRPHQKINHAVVLGGLQGIGKDTLLEPVKIAVGPWNFTEISPSHLLGRFNGFVKSVILRVSEARDLGDVDRYAFYDRTKIYTAAPPDVLRVDEKNLREYAVFNVCGVILTTNHKIAGLYLPEDDRRHYVAWSPRAKEDFEPGYWVDLYQWYAAGGDQHVAAYLADLDLTAFDPKAPPPKTAAFWEIVDANRAPEDAELADALDRLGSPDAITKDEVATVAAVSFSEWLRDRRNSRQIPHRFEANGYVAVRNPDAKDGLWCSRGRRHVVYAKRELSAQESLRAARQRVGGGQ